MNPILWYVAVYFIGDGRYRNDTVGFRQKWQAHVFLLILRLSPTHTGLMTYDRRNK